MTALRPVLTVRELMQKLGAMNPDAVVRVSYDHGMGSAIVLDAEPGDGTVYLVSEEDFGTGAA